MNDKVTALITGPQWPQDIAATANIAEKNKTPFVAFAGPFEPNNGLREASGKWQYTWESGFAIGAPTPPGDFRRSSRIHHDGPMDGIPNTFGRPD